MEIVRVRVDTHAIAILLHSWAGRRRTTRAARASCATHTGSAAAPSLASTSARRAGTAGRTRFSRRTRRTGFTRRTARTGRTRARNFRRWDRTLRIESTGGRAYDNATRKTNEQERGTRGDHVGIINQNFARSRRLFVRYDEERIVVFHGTRSAGHILIESPIR
jgi:hypothetical protein